LDSAKPGAEGAQKSGSAIRGVKQGALRSETAHLTAIANADAFVVKKDNKLNRVEIGLPLKSGEMQSKHALCRRIAIR
jgi:hypothetical protein